MNPSESFGFAEATASGAYGQIDGPMVNNDEIIFGPGDIGSGSGATTTPTQNDATTASASEGQPGGSGSVPLSSPVAASGQTLLYGIVAAAIVLALVLHHKH
jgi:hypothetical protein